MKPFSVQTTGKWILAGEHAVLRGCPALVFPLESRRLQFIYEPLHGEDSVLDLSLTLSGEHGSELQILFWGVLEKACAMKNLHRPSLTGHVRIHSGIPVGAGLGASAALCVAVSRWFQFMGHIDENEVSEFARHLENLFHGESSGVDIAVALSGTPLRFLRGQSPENLQVSWKPHLYISYSGQRGVTLDCVSQVKRLIETNPDRGVELDQRMQTAVRECERALRLDREAGFAKLAAAIDLSAQCFADWGLTEGAPEKHLSWLKNQGAVAAKPTGSGKGGFALSLWRGPVPESLREQLIPCFSDLSN